MAQVAFQEEQNSGTHLLPNEHEVYIAKRHWISQVPAFLALTVSGAFAFWLLQNSIQQTVSFSSFCILAAMSLSALYCYLRLRADHIVLTEKYIVVHEGFLRPRSISVSMKSVEKVDVISGVFESRFNVGALNVRLTNGTKLCQHHIARPRTFRNKWAALSFI